MRKFAAITILSLICIMTVMLYSCTASTTMPTATTTIENNNTPMPTATVTIENTPVPSEDTAEIMPTGTPDVDKPDNGDETKSHCAKTYEALISEWKSAFNSYKSGEYTYDGMLNFDFYDMSDADSLEAYYSLYDIDGNGTTELILRKRNSYEDIIAYIFAMKDGNPLNIFGYAETGEPIQVPWSRDGSSRILDNGLIDSISGDYSIYRIADDGYTVLEFASSEPYNYADMASLAEADWKYFINNSEVDYDSYVQCLYEQGYDINGNNTLASIDWISIN